MKKLFLLSLLISVNYSTFCQTHLNDASGSKYESVVIDNMTWSKSNLSARHFRNGDPITIAKYDEEWWALIDSIPVCAYYDYDSLNSNYGLIYNQLAIKDSREIAPNGWHVASVNDWKKLKNFDSTTVSLRVPEEWKQEHKSIPLVQGTNSSNFSCLPAGMYHASEDMNRSTYLIHYWTNNPEIFIRFAYYKIKIDNKRARKYGGVDWGCYIRIVKD
jgi:uncharacterized protein (TIGR02145 family)